jgi:5-formyltetrahydrofolate cyclo-ligase
MHASAISDKACLRGEARARRHAFVAGLGADERRSLEAAIAQRALPLVDGASVVGSYVPMGGEVDPFPFISLLADRVLALPWFESRASEMRFRRAGALEPGPFGTMQPVAGEPLVDPAALLVPLVAADLACNRLGQGQGHFDRTLAVMRRSGLRAAIGLAWDVQIIDVLPTDHWDQRLDAVVTPTRVLRANG